MVECVHPFTFAGMDVVCALEAELRWSDRFPLPDRWRADPVLRSFGSLDEVVRAVRPLGASSDRVLRALLDQPVSDRLVVPVVVVGFVPVVLARCRDRGMVDEFVGELAIEVAAAQRDGPPAVSGLLASRLLDRAWDRVRAPARRADPLVPVDPAELMLRVSDVSPSPEDRALARVEVAELRSFVAGCQVNREPLVRSWNSAVELAGRELRTASERDRWKYVRAQLRERCGAVLAV